jgi:hypothetical protein
VERPSLSTTAWHQTGMLWTRAVVYSTLNVAAQSFVISNWPLPLFVEINAAVFLLVCNDITDSAIKDVHELANLGWFNLSLIQPVNASAFGDIVLIMAFSIVFSLFT